MIKRLRELEKGDVFVWVNCVCVVMEVTPELIKWGAITGKEKRHSLGANSSWKVEYRGKIKPPETIKELKRYEAVYSNGSPFNSMKDLDIEEKELILEQ